MANGIIKVNFNLYDTRDIDPHEDDTRTLHIQEKNAIQKKKTGRKNSENSHAKLL